jgi:hypothetical protein
VQWESPVAIHAGPEAGGVEAGGEEAGGEEAGGEEAGGEEAGGKEATELIQVSGRSGRVPALEGASGGEGDSGGQGGGDGGEGDSGGQGGGESEDEERRRSLAVLGAGPGDADISRAQNDLDELKSFMAKLVLGNDFSGGAHGHSPALTVSLAITNLAAGAFGEMKRFVSGD